MPVVGSGPRAGARVWVALAAGTKERVAEPPRAFRTDHPLVRDRNTANHRVGDTAAAACAPEGEAVAAVEVVEAAAAWLSVVRVGNRIGQS